MHSSCKQIDRSFESSFLDGLLISCPSVAVLDIKTAHVLQAQLHALLLGGGEQFVLEGIDACVEALGIEVDRQLLVLHQSHLLLFN